MKAKYYMECSVLHASCGKKKKTFVCLEEHCGFCGLVNEGLVWKAGNGKSICIWQDRWLNLPTMYKVLSPPKVIDLVSMVNALIDNNTK